MVRATSGRVKTLSLVLIVSIGLLNFHIPHFLIEQPTSLVDGSAALELVFVGDLVGALVAAVGIYLDKRWGWLLGMVIVATSVVLYLALYLAAEDGHNIGLAEVEACLRRQNVELAAGDAVCTYTGFQHRLRDRGFTSN